MGVYILTNLVTGSLSERLTNQLLEAGRVVSDDVVRQELSHVQDARQIAYTRGLPNALANDSLEGIRAAAMPLANASEIENLFVYDKTGEPRLHLVRRPDGGLGELLLQDTASLAEMAASILAENDLESLPRRIIDIDPADQRRYYYTAVPIPDENVENLAGVVIVGTSVDTIIGYFNDTSLANIILYDLDGIAYNTTFPDAESLSLLPALNISADLVSQIRAEDDIVSGENLNIGGREYRLARGSLRVSDTDLGVFAVALPLQFVLETAEGSRDTYVLFFSIAVALVIVLGYIIANGIIRPLSSLVDTSQAITAGDLTKRSGIESKDEIGTLAHSFDEMTTQLQKHTFELQRTNRMLEQMDQAKASFIQVAAHELRTPLTLVKGYAQMLQGEARNNPNLSMLSKGIEDGYERMAVVVGNMLDISKIDSQMLQVVPTPQQIDLTIQQVERQFVDALNERQITIQKHDLTSLPVVGADPDLIKKAFYHLIINAIKYTPDGGTITISGRTLPENDVPVEVEVVIEDTGIGIAKEHQELIFEKFYQTGEVLLHSSGKTNFKGGGPGLGLAITYGIIEAHQGRVWVESPGYNEETFPGSKFYVRIPLEQKS